MKTRLTKAVTLLRPEEVDQVISESKNVLTLIYKHSPTCGLSAMAIQQMELFAKEMPEGIKLYYVDVIGSRKASQRMEAITGILHESPQVLFLRHGQCIWHASHRKITAEALNAVLATDFLPGTVYKA